MPFLNESQDPEHPIKESTEPRGGASPGADCDSAVAVNECADSESIVPDMEEVLKLQTANEDISTMLTYLTSGNLPADKKRAQRVVLESKLFSVIEGVD